MTLLQIIITVLTIIILVLLLRKVFFEGRRFHQQRRRCYNEIEAIDADDDIDGGEEVTKNYMLLTPQVQTLLVKEQPSPVLVVPKPRYRLRSLGPIVPIVPLD